MYSRLWQMTKAKQAQWSPTSVQGDGGPSMVIFKAVWVKDKWCEAAPSGYTIKATDSGYIDADFFSNYGKEFCPVLKGEEFAEARPKAPCSVGSS